MSIDEVKQREPPMGAPEADPSPDTKHSCHLRYVNILLPGVNKYGFLFESP